MSSSASEAERSLGQPANMPTVKRISRQKLELSTADASAILEKHQLGRLITLKPLEANPMNSIFELAPERGDSLILKIQCRSGIGSLAGEHYAIHLLRQLTDLPVSSLCTLDDDRDIIPYPYLLSNKLSGESGYDFFERTDHTNRIQLSEALGYIVGVIHSLEVAESEHLRNCDLNQWQEIVSGALLGDGDFREEVAAVLDTFYPQLNDLMASVSTLQIDDEPVLLWGDVFFYNLLVKSSGSKVQITGIYDFQFAAYGSRLFDFYKVEGDFRVRHPREIYGHPEYIKQFYTGYEGAGQAVNPPSDTHQILVNIIRNAIQVRYWWWDCFGILHPKTPEYLKAILVGLAELSGKKV
jgi:Ser/Thr protein kinase RdoA (MazF antagonist)